MKRKIPREYQKNNIKLVLTNDELDWFESLFNKDSSPIAEYIKQQIKESREVA